MMRIKFLEAVRNAQASQSAEYVVIWHDMEQVGESENQALDFLLIIG